MTPRRPLAATPVRTVADLLAAGLALPALPTPPAQVPAGTCCAITGAPLTRGYPVRACVSDRTAELLDTFRGDLHGYVSEAAARCWRHCPSQSLAVVEHGPAGLPLLSREAAQTQGRPCWAALVRALWPTYAGAACVFVLTTDTHRRLWPGARLGVLGAHTPVLVYDTGLSLHRLLTVDWRDLLACLDLVEQVYTAGWPKRAIGTSLYQAARVCEQVGLPATREYEQTLARRWRPGAAFVIALLIAQRATPPVAAPAPTAPAAPAQLELL